MAVPSSILVTGSAGRVGQAVVVELKNRGRSVRGFDRIATPGLEDFVVGDIANGLDVRRAMAGCEMVIHLAAIPDDEDFLTLLLPNNIVGVYHVLEEARQVGVRRLILASSGQVVWWQRVRGPWPIPADAPPTPRSWYASCKLFMEAAGRAHAESHGVSVIIARLGWCPRTREHAEELEQTSWGRDLYLSQGDAGRFFAAAVEAPDSVRFAIVYAASKPWGVSQYDLAPAKDLLGFEPQDKWPEGFEN